MTGGRNKHRLQRALVVAQVAVSVVLLAGAGLLTRTMIQLSEVSTGLRTEEVLTMEVQLITLSQLASFGRSGAAFDAAKERYDRIRREIRSLPGVVEVGLGSTMPLRGTSIGFDVKAEAKSLAVGEAVPRADVRTADPGYFRAAGIPLRAGRDFLASDRPGSDRVVIINQTLADRFFPTKVRSASDSPGRATYCASHRSAATGARSLAWWGTRRTADSMRSLGRRCSCPSRRKCRWEAAW